MKFCCETCNYSTDTKFCYEKHLKTKKHSDKVITLQKSTLCHQTVNKQLTVVNVNQTNNSESEKFECAFCNTTFNKKQSLSRHKNTCAEKQKLTNQIKELSGQLENIIKTKDDVIKTKDDMIKIKDDTIANEIARREEVVLLLTSETKNLKTILSSAGTLVEKSMSNFNFLNTHYNEAPALTYVTDVPSLHVDLAEDKVANRIMNEYNNNTLTSFIGKLIVKHYKKKNPKEQSIWNSDNDRLTYMIRTILSEKNNQNQWEVDKKGINTTLHIIQPILDHIKLHLKTYIQTCDAGSRRDSAETVLAISRRIETAYKIVIAIKKGEIANDILKYISPRLYIVKDLDLIV